MCVCLYTCTPDAARDADSVFMIEKYLRAVGMFRDFSNADQDPTFSQVHIFIYCSCVGVYICVDRMTEISLPFIISKSGNISCCSYKYNAWCTHVARNWVVHFQVFFIAS